MIPRFIKIVPLAAIANFKFEFKYADRTPEMALMGIEINTKMKLGEYWK